MLKEYLEKAYGYNEPIFISEIQLEGISDNALRQYFKEKPMDIFLAPLLQTRLV